MVSRMMLLVLCVAFIQLATAKQCPDKLSSCTDVSTCCPMLDNLHYGCCPQPNAVCCSDHVHCCPAGMACDVKRKRCTVEHMDGGNIMWLLALLGRTETPLVALQKSEKVEQTWLEPAAVMYPEVPAKVTLMAALTNHTNGVMVPCPDKSVCPGDYTCCPFSSGNFGCCPYPKGVCCPDHLSCCPNASTCTNNGTCARK